MSNRVSTKSNAKIHVLHVVPGLLAGGMELGMAKVVCGLNNGRMRHSVVALTGEPEIADRLPASAEVHCMHAWSNEPALPFRLARLIRRIRPTVVHARNWGAWPDTAAARLLARRKLPLILSFHGLGKAGYMPLRRRLASWVLARMATSLLAVSNQSKELMVAKWGWPCHKVDVIPNGVDTDRFAPAAKDRNGQRVIVGTVGNLRPVKNHALLVQACGDLVRRGVDLEVRIAGEGDERANLVSLAASLGLENRLQLAGRVEDVPGFLRNLDVFVLSSDSEQHPNALNEAMACGLACVATRVGCVDELLCEGRCGKIVSPGDRAQMAAAIGGLISSPSLKKEVGAVARRRACEGYSLQTMLNAYDRLYSRLSGFGSALTCTERPYDGLPRPSS